MKNRLPTENNIGILIVCVCVFFFLGGGVLKEIVDKAQG